MEEANDLVILQGAVAENRKEDRALIVEMVRRWGGATTDAVLDPSMQYFTLPNISGMIGYRLKARCAIVFGDPICAAADRGILAEGFHRYMEDQGNTVVYIAVSQDYAYWAIEHVCNTLVEFGEELTLDPSCDPRKNTGTHGSLVRRKVKQAVREGVTVHEHLTCDPIIERAMEGVGEEWLKSRKGPQIHISDIYLFDDRAGKRWFYAKRGDSIVGTISLNQLQARSGWLINHLMITDEAPNGTPELLVVSALEALDKEGCRYATVGMVTVNELGEIVGLSKFSTWLARSVFKVAKKVAHLDGLNTFWGKYHPKSQPMYLLFSRNRVGIRELLGLKNALYGS